MWPSTDLADLYRDGLSLRQLWVRVKALAPNSALDRAIQAATVQADKDSKTQAIDDVMTTFGRR